MTEPQGRCPVFVVADVDHLGGALLQALNAAAHDRKQGIRAFVLSDNPRDQPPREQRLGVPILRLPCSPPQRRDRAARFLSFLRFLTNHRHEYDVIHCHGITTLAADCARIGRLLRKPVVATAATARELRELAATDRRGLRWLRRVHRLACLTEGTLQQARNLGFAQEQAVVVPGGVDTARFAPATLELRRAARRQIRIGDDDLAFLYVGRLLVHKGVDLLLQALAGCHYARNARLLIVGDGDHRQELERRARELRVAQRVKFFGEQVHVEPFYAAADAFVFPARDESRPDTLLEALASGLPAIATRIDGCTDVITSDSGVLVPVDDPQALAQGMDELARNPMHRAQLMESGRQRAEREFSLAAVAARLQTIYADP